MAAVAESHETRRIDVVNLLDAHVCVGCVCVCWIPLMCGPLSTPFISVQVRTPRLRPVMNGPALRAPWANHTRVRFDTTVVAVGVLSEKGVRQVFSR